VIGASSVLFLLSLALIPTIGGEFMPKLDEGALWVRSTMPYTISFEESSRIVPQIRAILRSFPEVTVVANEHGRPDDGTDPTGFFNAEFYVGLKPYSEWHGRYHSKPALIAAMNEKLSAFPGINFNYTQPAEDAVDEAETGLKSSLDVKLFGGDLQVLEERGKAITKVLNSVRGISHVTLVQELGQPSLTIEADRAKIVPQIRSIIASFPEVTVVGSEHGRPDDGTDATGFFNAEFFVGLKPYSRWHGSIRTKPQLIAAINDKLQSFPGITFNYTQPAEDAVDEAETGLKSALAVKIFGSDLNVL